MKKIYGILIALLIFCGFDSFPADKILIDGLYYYLSNVGGATWIKENCALVAPCQDGDYSGAIEIPEEVTYEGKKYQIIGISSYAFCYDREVTSIQIPNTVTEIGTNAFLDCRGLKTLTIPESVVKMEIDVFGGCTLKPLLILGQIESYTDVFKRMNTESIVCAHSSEISKIKQAYSGTVCNIDDPFYVEIIKTYINGVKFKITPNEYCIENVSLTSVTVQNAEATELEDGVYFAQGFTNADLYDNSYKICVYTKDQNDDEQNFLYDFETVVPKLSFSFTNTATSMTFTVTAEGDETIQPKRASMYITRDDRYQTKFYARSDNNKDGKFTLTYENEPMLKYTYKWPHITVYYDNGQREVSTTVADQDNRLFRTTSISYKIEDVNVGVTKCEGRISLFPNGAVLTDSVLYLTKDDVFPIEDGYFKVDRLLPNTKYFLYYNIKESNGGEETIQYVFTTGELILNTLSPKVVNKTAAILCAETNIEESEEHVGFEWRKIDAPDLIESNRGLSVIYDGYIEGRVNNLKTESYYKARPFYEARGGVMRYGEWIGFDPSDDSYFEATVHTYPIYNVTQNSVVMKAYVLAGTDDVIEQGFEYWPKEDVKNSRSYNDVSTVIGNGQIMTAEITDLRPSTWYVCRAYVKTAKDTTYGEAQEFLTSDISGFIDAEVEKTVIGYYNLQGIKLDNLVRGINIILYSDGSSKKVIIR